jgi:hypothetical protein
VGLRCEGADNYCLAEGGEEIASRKRLLYDRDATLEIFEQRAGVLTIRQHNSFLVSPAQINRTRPVKRLLRRAAEPQRTRQESLSAALNCVDRVSVRTKRCFYSHSRVFLHLVNPILCKHSATHLHTGRRSPIRTAWVGHVFPDIVSLSGDI